MRSSLPNESNVLIQSRDLTILKGHVLGLLSFASRVGIVVVKPPKYLCAGWVLRRVEPFVQKRWCDEPWAVVRRGEVYPNEEDDRVFKSNVWTGGLRRPACRNPPCSGSGERRRQCSPPLFQRGVPQPRFQIKNFGGSRYGVTHYSKQHSK